MENHRLARRTFDWEKARELRAGGMTLVAIGEFFGVSHQAIRYACVEGLALKQKERMTSQAGRVQYNCHLKRKYGITIEEYEDLLAIQNGVCALCQQVCSSGQRLSVDHDHETGRVRGLLCRRCNAAVGTVENCVDWLARTEEYLR